MGPTLGSACWRMTHRRTLAIIEAKDREFYRHIVKNRVDPRAQSTNNPVPDYYGIELPTFRETISDLFIRRENWLAAPIPPSTCHVIPLQFPSNTTCSGCETRQSLGGKHNFQRNRSRTTSIHYRILNTSVILYGQ